jgi:hypothetical protein
MSGSSMYMVRDTNFFYKKTLTIEVMIRVLFRLDSRVR